MPTTGTWRPIDFGGELRRGEQPVVQRPGEAGLLGAGAAAAGRRQGDTARAGVSPECPLVAPPPWGPGGGSLPFPAAGKWAGSAKKKGDRRKRTRFSLCLPLVCRWIEPCSPVERVVCSESRNISSRSLVIAATTEFEPGQIIEAAVAWPRTLDDGVNLTLVIEGLVVRIDGLATVVRIRRYEFRTRARAGGSRFAAS